ncbi:MULTISPECIES: DEAD/DEAH box helicase [Vagococcus]|uniref:COG0553: Superfamily II DNA/RNA helicases, SNF2 family n=1 Tax=Vagococcus fluvialis bH819 TaxID=1255619 RepID=A0A1X6WMD8_9ENTE|nr:MULTISPECIES: DEAD/DEAH box helicase [Vagococcus]SLM85503.1 COG0553: Superfamily II DNA/RNA helicases, SNF2 family [Vagococcus fluvialis bH819]HCM89470.1 Snf2 family helicase [Vagococcus sp.]
MKWSIPEKVVEEGREYAKDGRVVSISKNEEQQVWYADVVGSEVFHIELDGTAREEDVCQCPYWQQHGFCKHTVATELALREKGLNRYIKKQVNTQKIYTPPSHADIFSKSFERLQEAETEKTLLTSDPLKMEFIMDVVETLSFHPEQSVIAVSLKLGSRFPGSKTYVVKNIQEFLDCYEKRSTYKLNEKSFVIGENSFSQRDIILLDKLLEIREAQELLDQTNVQQKGKINRRYLILGSETVQFFVKELTKTERLIFNTPEDKKQTIYFKEGKLPIDVRISPVGTTDYKMVIEDPIEMYLEKYQWAIGNHSIYQLTNEQSERYELLLQLLKRLEEPEIVFTKDNVGELFSYILPNLDSVATIYVSDDLQSEMIRVPLRSKIWIEEVQGQLEARVDYVYGEFVFSSHKDHSTSLGKESQVIRNQVQEKRIEKLLQHFGYAKRKNAYLKQLPKEQELYAFIREEVPTIRKYAEVGIAPNVAQLFLNSTEHQPKVKVLEDGSWLDIQFDISNIDETEINDVLVSLMKQQDYHQLKSGQLLFLDEQGFKETSSVLQQLRGDIKVRKGKLEVPRYRGLMVNQALSEMKDVETTDLFTDMVQNLTHPKNYDVALPKGLNASLRDYQVTGFKWLKMLSHYQFGGILADDMGLGKTVQTITYLLSEKEEGKLTEPVLIVAPASLLYNWHIEIEKFAPDLKVNVVIGSKQERTEIIENYADTDILVTSYTTLRQDYDVYEKMTFHSLILDEAQMIKNAATKTFQTIETLKAEHYFALSGTPIENKLEELWALFRILMPGFFPPLRRFKQLTTETIATMIKPFVLRREKKEVLDDLPDKVETDLYSHLTEEQKTVYVAHLRQMQKSVAGMTKQELNQNRISILSGLTRLRQICCHPKLFIEDYEGDSGKMNQALDMIQTAKANGRRILLFSQFTGMLSILEEELAKLDIETFYLRGSTPLAKRQEMVDSFNRGSKDVFLISLKAGGTGLNLTGADTVILYDLWWNPAVEDQATGRAHRMGQKKKVEVWRLISEGTVEEKMNRLQAEKKELFRQVLNSESAKDLGKMTMEDIKDILDVGIE